MARPLGGLALQAPPLGFVIPPPVIPPLGAPLSQGIDKAILTKPLSPILFGPLGHLTDAIRSGSLDWKEFAARGLFGLLGVLLIIGGAAVIAGDVGVSRLGQEARRVVKLAGRAAA